LVNRLHKLTVYTLFIEFLLYTFTTKEQIMILEYGFADYGAALHCYVFFFSVIRVLVS